MLAAASAVDIAGSPQKLSVHPIWQHCPAGPCDCHYHLLYVSCTSTTQKGKTARIFLAVSEISVLNTFLLCSSTQTITLRQSDGVVLLPLPWLQAVAISLVPSLHQTCDHFLLSRASLGN